MTYLDETNVDAVYDAAEDANNQEVWVGLKVDDDGKYQVIIDILQGGRSEYFLGEYLLKSNFLKLPIFNEKCKYFPAN